MTIPQSQQPSSQLSNDVFLGVLLVMLVCLLLGFALGWVTAEAYARDLCQQVLDSLPR